ncbi:MAG: flagellar basal-body MS-ring/collar protein FliF, partial [Pseudomonadota bacterium]
ITNLVAGAVPELDPEDVSIVDQAGRLLTATVDSPGVNQSLKELDYVERVEARLKRNIYNLLVPSLGSEGFSTELVADVDFTQAEEAAEIYQPEVTSVRSESSTEEMEIGEQVLPVGVPGALANEPVRPSPAADGETVEQEPKRTRSQVTRNYEVDRTVSYTRKQRATIGRLSVSVLIKDRAPLPPAEEGGEAQPNPWSADELARFEALVKGAVGFSEARGDSVTVIAQPFAEIITPAAVTAAFWEQGWFGTLIKQVFGGLVLLMLMIGLLRPLIRNVSQAGAILKEQQALALARMSQENEAAEANAARQALAQDAAGPALPGPAAALSSDGGELGNKFEAIRGLVNDDPERAAQVVKHWVGRDE